MPKLSIIIPAYNEENRIRNTIILIENYLNETQHDAEIIIVDDGSTDRTREVVSERIKKNQNIKLIPLLSNQGKGFAIKTGVAAARGEYILFLDADNSTPIEELDKLERRMVETGAPIAIGSRYLNKKSVKLKQPFYRIWLSRIGNFLIRIVLGQPIRDTQCGFKLFKAPVAKDLFALQKVKRFGFDMEILMLAGSKGHTIAEVPVDWFNSPESRLRPVWDSLVTLNDLIKMKINLIRGKYHH